MPTPFTHLASAQRLLDDPGLPAAGRALLLRELPAFLLGSIAADGQNEAGLRREDTHFYTYDRPIRVPLDDLMLARYPELVVPESAAQRAFVAGYIGHLALDEIWTEAVMRPYFIDATWGSSAERFLMLNILLIGLDERDFALLTPSTADGLRRATPNGWLPFLPDPALAAWREIITRQFEPGALPETLPIIGARTGVPVAGLRALLDSPDALASRLWAHVPVAAVAKAEAAMHAAAVERVARYLAG